MLVTFLAFGGTGRRPAAHDHIRASRSDRVFGCAVRPAIMRVEEACVMKTLGAILCLSGAVFWATAAQAECAWQTQCDGDGICQDVEVCGDAANRQECDEHQLPT